MKKKGSMCILHNSQNITLYTFSQKNMSLKTFFKGSTEIIFSFFFMNIQFIFLHFSRLR